MHVRSRPQGRGCGRCSQTYTVAVLGLIRATENMRGLVPSAVQEKVLALPPNDVASPHVTLTFTLTPPLTSPLTSQSSPPTPHPSHQPHRTIFAPLSTPTRVCASVHGSPALEQAQLVVPPSPLRAAPPLREDGQRPHRRRLHQRAHHTQPAPMDARGCTGGAM